MMKSKSAWWMLVGMLLFSTWAGATTYSYDALNRLTAVAYTGGGGQTFSYDAAGNLLALVSTPPVVGSTTTTTTTTTSSTSGTSSTTTVATTTTTTQPGAALSYTLQLAQGWNLLGNSLTVTQTVATVYNDPALVTTVWKWDRAQAGWQFYSPAMDLPTLQAYASAKGYGVLSVINPGEGFWVNAKAARDMGTQTGTAFSLTAANLFPLWNLVATGNNVSPSVFNRSLSATPLNLTSLWAWDNASSRWYFYAPALEANGGLGAYIVSKSYLDFMSTGKTLGNGVGFWVNKP